MSKSKKVLIQFLPFILLSWNIPKNFLFTNFLKHKCLSLPIVSFLTNLISKGDRPLLKEFAKDHQVS